jgi:zinc protease
VTRGRAVRGRPEVHLFDVNPRRAVLSNGLTLLTITRTQLPVVGVLIMYRAGSLYESLGKSGLAHLTEHMMFRGTPEHPQGDIDRLIGRLGGSNNAITTCDHATYYFVVPSEHWAIPLEIEADRMWHCDLGPGPFETERRVALEERAMLDDDPEAVASEALDSLAFDEHPYGHPVVGSAEDLAGLTLSDLREFYGEHYGASDAVLAVAGRISHEEVAAEVERLFGAGSAPYGRPERSPQASRSQSLLARGGSSPRHLEMSGLSPTPRVVMGYPTPEATHEDSTALELLCSLLSAGRSSVFYRELVDGTGMAMEVSAYKLPQVDPNLLYIGAALNAGESTERCEDHLIEVIERVRDSGVTDEALERARNLARVDLVLARETCLGAAGAVAFWESLGGWRLGLEHEERLAAVTAEDLRRVAAEYLDPDTRSSVWLVP